MSESGYTSLDYHEGTTRVIEMFMGTPGFMSPGGPESVGCTVGDAPVAGGEVLDFGCGIGGPDVVLARDHSAAHVVGVDVDASVLERARRHAAEHGLEGALEFRHIDPGPLPFADATFDLVFSTDAIVHVADKEHAFAEMYRVLHPDGCLAIRDFYCSEQPFTPEMRQWVEMNGFTDITTLAHTRVIVERAGFTEVTTEDLQPWYREQVDAEVERVADNFDSIVELVGAQDAQAWIDSGRLRQSAVHQGQIRPGHVRARKPPG